MAAGKLNHLVLERELVAEVGYLELARYRQKSLLGLQNANEMVLSFRDSHAASKNDRGSQTHGSSFCKL